MMRTPVATSRIIHGDAATVLPTFAAESFDALVTDPPFGIGFEYDGGREEHDDPAAYWAWLRPLYQDALRCVKPGGFVAIWQTQLYFPHFWHWFGEHVHVYIAAKNFVQFYRTPINRAYDPVVVFYKLGGEALSDHKIKGRVPRNADFYVADTAALIARPDLRPAHPCPRPVDQCVALIENFTRLGARVLDPFAGSGSIGIACAALGRHYVGVEVNPAYAALAEDRIADAESIVALWRRRKRQRVAGAAV